MAWVATTIQLYFKSHIIRHVPIWNVLDALPFMPYPRLAHEALKVSRSRLHCKIFIPIFLALLHKVFIFIYLLLVLYLNQCYL